jgi:hypothetical protein
VHRQSSAPKDKPTDHMKHRTKNWPMEPIGKCIHCCSSTILCVLTSPRGRQNTLSVVIACYIDRIMCSERDREPGEERKDISREYSCKNPQDIRNTEEIVIHKYTSKKLGFLPICCCVLCPRPFALAFISCI